MRGVHSKAIIFNTGRHIPCLNCVRLHHPTEGRVPLGVSRECDFLLRSDFSKERNPTQTSHVTAHSCVTFVYNCVVLIINVLSSLRKRWQRRRRRKSV